jgi:hypothetical protein
LAEGLQLTIMLADTLCEGAAIVSKMGSRAGQSASGGMCSGAFWWKLLAGHLVRRCPKDLRAPLTGLTSCVREPTNASRERMIAR